MPDNTSISITPFGRAGIRRQRFEEDHQEWDFVCLPVTAEQIHKVEMFYEHTAGEGYDWVGMIASKFTPFHVKMIHRWYCSEWIAYALRLICVVDNLYAYADLTPQRLHNLLYKYHGKKISLNKADK